MHFVNSEFCKMHKVILLFNFFLPYAKFILDSPMGHHHYNTIKYS
jgi:hypothetical protein